MHYCCRTIYALLLQNDIRFPALGFPLFQVIIHPNPNYAISNWISKRLGAPKRLGPVKQSNRTPPGSCPTPTMLSPTEISKRLGVPKRLGPVKKSNGTPQESPPCPSAFWIDQVQNGEHNHQQLLVWLVDRGHSHLWEHIVDEYKYRYSWLLVSLSLLPLETVTR